MEMRKVLCSKLSEVMSLDKNVVVINADLAKAAGLSPLIKKFPDRCFNVGVAEQNMASISAGLSSYGFNPFIFTFTPFATRRICDQIAVSICYAKQKVKIFGLDPGIAAENNGGTHMSFEDVGIMRSIPGMSIFEPCDEIQLEKSIDQIVKFDSSIYVRTFRKETPKVFDDNYSFDLFSNDVIKVGEDVSIFCTGIMVHESLKAYEILKSKGIFAEVINVHTLKPIEKNSIIKSIKKTKCAVCVENHNRYGGLFSAVCEISCENFPVPVYSVSINDEFGQVGNLEFLKKYYHLTCEDIVENVMKVVGKRV